MSKVIQFTSGKGGVGKTTLSANIGAVLAEAGFRTVIIDMDQGLRSADLLLGLENRIVYNITDAVHGRIPLSRILVRNKVHEKLSLLPATQVKDQSVICADDLSKIIAKLKDHFDYILIDGVSGIDRGFQTCLDVTDLFLLVLTPDVLSLRAADRVKALLREHKKKDIRLLINRFDEDSADDREVFSREDIETLLGLPICGVIPQSRTIHHAQNHSRLLVDLDCRERTILIEITQKLTDIRFELQPGHLLTTEAAEPAESAPVKPSDLQESSLVTEQGLLAKMLNLFWKG